ncbi:hypothetical protein HNO53_13040 [Billgrantia antri]|uniref:CopG family transcriptional regulator n=1 Tax=Halomonas sulfidivorans TaxID=2733488 RepID=A0ABX7WHP0_9GAMM|nr:hypothetical protein [Halomonas sulfidivorans]QTP59561.1 hypothetical protein HNO53_13040 [Halomonas sulfidivorans]
MDKAKQNFLVNLRRKRLAEMDQELFESLCDTQEGKEIDAETLEEAIEKFLDFNEGERS